MLIGACDDKRNLAADRADVTTRHIRGLMVMAAKHEEAFSRISSRRPPHQPSPPLNGLGESALLSCIATDPTPVPP